MKIVLVTSGQPSLNPRLIKEADTLAANGFEVVVLYAYWNDWGTQIDEQILPAKKWHAVRVGGHPKQQPLLYFISRCLPKAANFAFSKLGIKRFSDLAITRSTYFLQREAQKHAADLYIGHNLGALPAIANVAKKHNKPYGFDAEDFHRNEVSDDINNPDVKLKTFIEDKYIPQTDYLTASSKQIANAYKKLFPQLAPIVIKNVFANSDISVIPKDNSNNSLKLFWFSQTIGDKRGISDIIKALKLLKKRFIQLHLLGNIPPGNKPFINDLSKSGLNIIYHEPIAPDLLPNFASQFDIGLALEPGFCINNDLALSNKIFTYMQAGLAIIASDTTAQKEFFSQYSNVGKVYKRDDQQMLAGIINYYDVNKEELFKAKAASLELAHRELNWENESKPFMALINKTLSG